MIVQNSHATLAKSHCLTLSQTVSNFRQWWIKEKWINWVIIRAHNEWAKSKWSLNQWHRPFCKSRCSAFIWIFWAAEFMYTNVWNRCWCPWEVDHGISYLVEETPAFGVAAVAALASGLIAVLFIPRPGGQKPSLEAQYEVLCSFCIWHWFVLKEGWWKWTGSNNL